MVAAACADSLDEKNPGLDTDMRETVTLTLHANSETKTYLEDDRYVRWEHGDNIMINNDVYLVKVDPEDPTVAYVDSVTVADTYTAFYNRYLYYFGDEGLLLTIPEYQTYKEGSFDTYMNAMVAYGTSTDLYFYNAASLLKLGIMGDGNDVTITSLAVSSNGGEPIAGSYFVSYEQLSDLENFDGMEYVPEFSQMGSVNPTYVQNYVNVSFGEEGLKLSATEPQYVYVVVPPQTYAEGITVTMCDSEGRICMKSTDRSITAKRSTITPMADFAFFSAETALTVSAVEAGATSVNFKGTVPAGSKYIWCLVNGNAWNYYAGTNENMDESELAVRFLNTYGMVMDSEDGTIDAGTTYAANMMNYDLALVPDTDYKLLVSYSVGDAPAGMPVIKDVRTDVASGEEPEIAVAYEIGGSYLYLRVYMSDDVDALSWEWETKETMDSLLREYTPAEIIGINGGSVYKDSFGTDEDGRKYCDFSPMINPDENYVFHFLARTATGSYVLASHEIKQENSWSTYTTEASMSCDFLLIFQGGEVVDMTGLTVEKKDGEDMFRVLGVFSRLNEWAEGELFDTSDGDYVYIDANDPQAVVMPYGDTYAYFNGTPLYYCTAAAISGSYSAGTYDKTTGVIVLPHVVYQLGEDSIYLVSETTVTTLVLPTESESSGLDTEDFTGADKVVEW